MVLSMEKWLGKVAVVTGASAGCGEAISKHLVKHGLKVVGIARRKDKLLSLTEELKGQEGSFYPFETDITKAEEIINAFKWIEENIGDIHVLINNAGIAHPSSLLEGNYDKWNQVFQTNVLGLCVATKEAVNRMKRNNTNGHVIHINSVLGHYVAHVPDLNVYPATKFAVTALTEVLRQELNAIDSKIRVTSVSPGPVETEFAKANNNSPNEKFDDFFEKLPKLLPEDVADAVGYVLSTPLHVQMGPAAAFLLILSIHLQEYSGEIIYNYQPEVVIRPRVRYIDDCTTCVEYPSESHEGKVYVTDQYGRTSRLSSGGVTKYARTEFLPATVTGCTANTCGQNAQCTIAGGRPVCSCFNGYTGDPLTYCRRAECLDNSECRGHLTCVNEKCVNPCEGVCGLNADCEVRNHVPICTCPPGYTGSPFTQCRRFNPEELCHPSPCGANTQCEVVNNVPTCKCLPGYHGSAIAGCRHECESDVECGPQSACLEFKCQNPCTKCGNNAECEGVRNHVAICKCPRGYFGNPLISCQPECVTNSDCPPGKPACFYNQCKNPCDGVCGINANCELKNGITPVCSCPRDMTGNPFVSCRPFTKEDLCEPNPCGQNAKCTPGHDRTGKERPVCTCLPGYTGDPLKACIRGECLEDSECPDSRACINLSCQNPCINQCGINAMCDAKRHIAVCTCFPGYNGDALTHCHPVETTEVKATHRCTTCY